VTFFEEGQEVLNQEAHAVAEHFDANPSFGGFAIHHYGHSYLGELLGWPPFNGGFPIETNTPEGANIVVEPVDAATGTTPVTVTFSEVAQPSGNTSLTTSSVGSTPPAGFQLGDPPIYYDLTTTAVFTPPIEVCIDYSGTSFTGPEDDLRLFHFEDPDWVDHTLLPVDTANKMICASVTSLSPFAVFERANQPPVANAGPDQTAEADTPGTPCGASVTLDGSGSSDPDGDALTYTWTGPFPEDGGAATGVNPIVTLPLGPSIITLMINDGTEDSAPDTVDITVQDTTPPVITVATEPITLWPPNHKYHTIAVSDFVTSITDLCDADVSLSNVVITSVLSDEAEDATGGGDGNTLNDIVLGADCQSVYLRAERQGGGNGRVYTIHVAASDASGNTGEASFQVHVPHDKKSTATDDGAAYAVGGF